VIPIHRNFQGYNPPRWFDRTIERLVSSLSDQHLSGLQSIVLTNSSALGKGKTRRVRGRKYQQRDCRAFYHHAWHGERPWIEIVVDNVLQTVPRFALSVNLVRDVIVGKVLYHEVGHHLQKTLGSAGRGGEHSADDWATRLLRLHVKRLYWYWKPIVLVFGAVSRALRKTPETRLPRACPMRVPNCCKRLTKRRLFARSPIGLLEQSALRGGALSARPFSSRRTKRAAVSVGVFSRFAIYANVVSRTAPARRKHSADLKC